MRFILTEAGSGLQAKVEAGLQLTICRVAASDEMSDHPERLKKLLTEKQELQLDDIAVDGDRAIIIVALSNIKVTEAYTLHSIGVYAFDENKEEVLFLIGQDVAGDEIKPGSEEEIVLEYNIALKISNAGQVTFIRNLDDYVRKRQFEEHVEAYKALLQAASQMEERIAALQAQASGLQQQMDDYCPFVMSDIDIPVYERVENKFYLFARESRGIDFIYCAQFYDMGIAEYPIEERKDMCLYGHETAEKSVLGYDESERVQALQLINGITLNDRNLTETELRGQDILYMYETEERVIWQE